MSSVVTPPPAGRRPAYLGNPYRFTVEQYRALTGTVLPEGPGWELLEGVVVKKVPQDPPHAGCVRALTRILGRLLPAGWETPVQSPVALADSEPEPDVAVVRADPRGYFARHPGPADIALVVEVADSSLDDDRHDKGRIYARAGVPVYWVVNLPDRQVEVYADPQPAADPPGYAARTDYRPGEAVPLPTGGAVPVAELLP
jgi:Uma2 family endonuclease